MSKVKMVVWLLVVGLMGMAAELYAASTDTIVLLVTPRPSLSVKISSPTDGVGYDFTVVDLGDVSQSGLAATVENDGTGPAQWMLRAEAIDTWQVDTSTSEDNAVIQALFGQPGGEYPSIAMFDQVDSTLTTSNRSSQNDNLFSTGGILGASIPASGTDSRLLWFKIKMPPTTSVEGEQKFRVYAVAGNP